MPPRKKREPSVLLNEACTLGWDFVEERTKCVKSFEEKVDDGYIWIQEVLVEIKKSLAKPDVELCPKTPSKKKKRGRQRKLDSINSSRKESLASQDFDSSITSTDSQEDPDTAKPSRSTRTTRANTSKNTGGRSTRSRKAKAGGAETKGPEPSLNLASVVNAKDDKIVTFESEDGGSEKETKNNDIEDVSTPKRERETISPQKSVKDNLRTPTNNRIIKSPISAIKTAIRAKTPVTKIGSGNSPRSMSPRSQSPRTRLIQKTSPQKQKTFPNFNVLTVKQKATAYEQHMHKVNYPDRSCSSSEETQSPRKAVLSKETNLESEHHDAENSETLGVPVKSNAQRRSTRRSSTARRVSGMRSSLRISMSKKRSSIMRHKLRTSQVMSKQVKQQFNESIKSSPEKSQSATQKETTHVIAHLMPLVSKAVVKPRKGYRGKAVTGNTFASVRKIHAVTPVRSFAPSPRSQPRLCEVAQSSPKAPSTAKTNNASTNRLVQGKKTMHISHDISQGARSTRSKLRLNKIQHPPSLTPASSASSCDEQSGASTRTTRSSLRASQESTEQAEEMETDHDEVDGNQISEGNASQPPPTPPSSSDETSGKNPRHQRALSAPRSTRAAMKRFADQSQHSPSEFNSERVSMSVKRPNPEEEEEDELNQSKRQCLDSEGDEELVHGTPPEQRNGPRIIKPLRGGYPDSAQKRPGNINSSVKSFIQRNTPQKKSFKEAEDERRRQVESKGKEAERRLAKREEQQQKRRLELKRQREERQRRVVGRRKEQENKDQELKMHLVQKLGSGSKPSAKRIIEDRVKEEKEKREKKMAEAEQRRKQVEEIRLQRLRDQEEEQKRIDEQNARRRQEDEKERMRRIAEQQRLEEERRLAVEREREREAARKKQYDEELRRRQEAERREREEREKKERAERERQERQRQEERERQKREELHKTKELELKRLREERAREQERLREEREVASMIKKHNSSLQQNSSSLNTSNNQASNASKLQQQTQQANAMMKAKLNSSYTVKPRTESQDSADSYELTPVRKKVVKKSTEEDYGIGDIRSDDSTDEEDRPRKKIPNWAVGAQLKASLIQQYYQPPDLDCIFDTVIPPDLNSMFIKKRPRFNKRTSSAVWDSPILKPSGAYPT